jgi:DNA invertase Pin-like site-specific DNA recombinase
VALIPVIAVIRVSTGKQAGDDRYSIPVQKQACIELAKRYGLRIVRFETVTICGADSFLTTAFKGILESIESGEIKGVVTRESDRLIRFERYEDLPFFQMFQDNDAFLYTLEGVTDFNDPNSQFQANMRFIMAGLERHKIHGRTQTAGLAHRKAGGRWGVISKGVTYRRKGKEHFWGYDNEKEGSKLVRAAYEQLFKGASLAELSRMLGTTRTGARTILSNTIYKGVLTYSHELTKRKRGEKQRRIAARDERQVSLTVIDSPLVSESEWNRAQSILKEINDSHRRDGVAARARRAAEGREPRALYSGFVFCDYCGRLMTPINGHKSVISYVCIGRRVYKSGCPNKYIIASKLEANIDHVFSTVVTDPAFRRRLAMHLERARRDESLASDVVRLREQIKALDSKRRRIAENFDDGVYTKAERDEKLAAVDETRRIVSNDLERASCSVTPALDESLLQAAFEAFVGWSMLDIEGRRRVLAITAPRLRIRDGQMVSFFRSLDGGSMPVSTAQQTATESRTRREANSQIARTGSH